MQVETSDAVSTHTHTHTQIRVCVCERVRVVISRAFIFFLLHNNFITKKIKKKSGDVNYEANFLFFFLLHK